MQLKREGEQFAREDWEPRHPARWCWLKVIISMARHGGLFTPRGLCWSWQDHNWTCYMRLRKPQAWWPHVLGSYNHSHQHFVDPLELRRMVDSGLANDAFMNKKYVTQELTQ